MRIGLIGGLERAEQHYGRVAAEAGHEAVFHDGHIRGRGARTLENLVTRCDVVVVVTDVNSHAAVQIARQRLRALGRAPLLLRRCGLAHFAKLLEGLTQRAA